MTEPVRQFLIWAPRTLGIFLAALVGLAASGATGDRIDFGGISRALPVFLGLIVAILVVAWRREWVGGILLPALGVAWMVMCRGRLAWGQCAAIAGPLVLTGILFLACWRFRMDIRTGS